MMRFETTIWTTAFFILVLSSFSFATPPESPADEYAVCATCGTEVAEGSDVYCMQCDSDYLVERRTTQTNNWAQEYPQNEHGHQEANQLNQNNRFGSQSQRSASASSHNYNIMPKWGICLLIGTAVAEFAASTTSLAYHVTANKELKNAATSLRLTNQPNVGCKDSARGLVHDVPENDDFSSSAVFLTAGSDFLFGSLFFLLLPGSDTLLWPSLLTVLRTGIAVTGLASLFTLKNKISDTVEKIDTFSQTCEASKVRSQISDASDNIQNSIIASAVRLGMSALDVILIIIKHSQKPIAHSTLFRL